MKNNNDFEFISSKFEEENVTAPESLSAEELVQNFDKKNVSNIVKLNKNTRGFKTFIAAVACIALIITSVTVGVKAARQPVKFTENNPRIEGISYFKSYESLNEKLSDITKKQEGGVIKNFGGLEKGIYMTEDAASENTADGELKSASPAEKSHAETNKQVEGIDEADIVKTDGKYIYYIPSEFSGGNDIIMIYSADKGKSAKVSQIELDEGAFKEMYLDGDKLIAVGTSADFSKNGFYGNYNNTSFVKVYDISDVKKPELINEYQQDGNYVTSRYFNSTAYVISDYYKFSYMRKKEIVDFVPKATDEKGDVKKIPVDDICCIDGCERSGYAVVGAVDVKSKKKKTYKTKAILGASENVYCNEEHLFLSTTDYQSDKFANYGYTRLVKFDLNKTKINVAACGGVKGTVNDQFSLDEKDGNLRVATTVRNAIGNGKDKNYLYILNKDLNQIGDVSGFARNEHIEAVRYIGDTAYVITFEQTDPLFIIDLSDPRAPEITGEVKIDGFSSSLTPVDENTLLGIGYATKTNEFGGVQTNGLKVVLFDISNKNKPKVISEKEFNNYSSPAQDNHKAIVINKDKGYFAIPMNTDYGYDGFKEDERNSVGIIKINKKGLDIKLLKSEKEYKNNFVEPYDDAEENDEEERGDVFIEEDMPQYERIERCTYVGDFVYALYSNENSLPEAFEIK